MKGNNMIQFLQNNIKYIAYIMCEYMYRSTEHTSKHLFFYPLPITQHMHMSVFYLHIWIFHNTQTLEKDIALSLLFKNATCPLPFCSKSVESAAADAWRTSLDEVCMSMASITSLWAGNLQRIQQWYQWSAGK